MSLEEYSKKRFLIVDELDSFRFSTKKTLQSLGLKLISTASSAQEVISGFQNVNYDVILCNYELGTRKNGQELLEELRYRKLLKFTGLFFIISAEVEKSKVMGTVENEPDGYLVKPITPQDLEQRLAKALQMQEAMYTIYNAIDEGDYHSAIAYCDRKITEQDRYTQRCLKTKAWLLTKVGDLELAKDVYETVLHNNALPWAEYGLAKIAVKTKDYQKAETLLNHVIEVEPHQVEAMDLLAEIYKRQNRNADAQEVVKKAIALSPNALLRQKELADLCIQNNQTEDALEAFRKVVKLGDQSIYAKPDQYYDFANFLASSAKDDEDPNASPLVKEAFELLTKGKKRFSSHLHIEDQAKLVSANVNAIIGNHKEAQELFESVMGTGDLYHLPDLDAKSYKIAAQALSSLGKQEQAEQLLERAADIAAGDPELVSDIYDQLNVSVTDDHRQQAALINKKGIKLYNEGKIEQAAHELRQAIPLTPRHISLNLNLAQVLLKLHKQTPTPECLKDAGHFLRKVRHMPKHHKEFRRYQYLSKLLKDRTTVQHGPSKKPSR